MSLFNSLLGFGLRQVLGDGVGNVVESVQQRFRDHSRALPDALARAQDRAWQSLGVALAGDGLLDRVKVFFASGDDRGVRAQVQMFLQDNAFTFTGTPDNLRRSCLDELKRLRKSGLLSGHALNAEEVGQQTAGFQRDTDQASLIAQTQRAIAGVADALAQDYPNLSRLIRRPTPAGPPLLAAAFCYFFRREVETNEELAHGLFFDSLRQLTVLQERAFGEVSHALTTLGLQFDVLFEQLGRIEAVVVETHGAVLDLQAELRRLGGMHLSNADGMRALLMQVSQQLSQIGMQQGEVKPQHSCSIRGEDERRAVKSLLERYRSLPPEEQRQMPALLNGLGKLQLGAGDFAAARLTFAEVVAVVPEAEGQAEASYNTYRVALEEHLYDAALEALRRAASLDTGRFAPFPLHRYEAQRILGVGGFGTALLCKDRHFDEEVVVKTLHAADLERGLEDVFREARTLRKLSHPAIIGVRDCDYADPVAKARPYLVMDYFPGVTLEEHIRTQGPLAVGDLVAVATQLAQAMQAAHAQGILHRDLKPANVLIRKEGDRWQLKVIDFGLALRKQVVETSVAISSAGNTVLSASVAGTVQYAPPEQMGRLHGVKMGPWSDVYAFGKTCSFALFRTTEPRSRHLASLPAELRELLEGCIEQELEHRHASFEKVLPLLGVHASAEEVARRVREEQKQRKQENARRLREEQRHLRQEESRRAAEEQERRKQEEATRQQQERIRLRTEGEEKLARLVRTALERTFGRPTAEDTEAAREVVRQHRIDKHRAEDIVSQARTRWQAEPILELRIQGEWFARPKDNPQAEWAKVLDTPGRISPRTQEIYHLTIASSATWAQLETLTQLRGLPFLQSLDLSWCNQLTDRHLNHLRSFPALRYLNLKECRQLSNTGLTFLLAHSALQDLNLEGCEQLTDATLAQLRGFSALQDLNLSGCVKLTDAGLAHLRGLTALRSLNLSGCVELTDECLAHLSGLSALQNLNLFECNHLTDSGLAHLRGLTALEHLCLWGCRLLTDAGLARLRGLSALQSLNLGRCERLTDAGLTQLGKLCALKDLNLWGCEQWTNAGLVSLRGLSALRSLNLSWCRQLTDAGLAHLTGLTALQVLNLTKCEQLTDASLYHLSCLSALQSLSLSGCEQLTDTGVGHLWELFALRHLDLSACQEITDEALSHLSYLSALQFLDLKECPRVTDAGLARLQLALPRCNIER